MAAGWVTFIIVLLLIILFAAAAWVVYTHLRARRLGLPPPPLNPFSRHGRSSQEPYTIAPAPGGIIGWVNDKFRSLKNRRTAGGAYEETSSGAGGRVGRRAGFGPLDPDEAWDSRVGNEADMYGPGGYYEEQELGLHPPAHAAQGGNTAYSGAGYAAGGAGDRGRSRSRELDERYDEEMGGRGGQNPFGDGAERSDMSLRGVSPRPIDTGRQPSRGHQKGASLGTQGDSPTERRSMFREDM